jgi:hypothetical protein
MKIIDSLKIPLFVIGYFIGGAQETSILYQIGYKCCEKEFKTYFLKTSELNDKFHERPAG